MEPNIYFDDEIGLFIVEFNNVIVFQTVDESLAWFVYDDLLND